MTTEITTYRAVTATVTPSLSFITGMRMHAKYSHKYTTAPSEIRAIVSMEFSRPLSMYHARITNPIATALARAQTIFTDVLSLTISASTPLAASIAMPIIRGVFTSSKACCVSFATTEQMRRKRNETIR